MRAANFLFLILGILIFNPPGSCSQHQLLPQRELQPKAQYQRHLQIAFPGNFLGDLVQFDPQGTPHPARSWEIPPLLDSLRHDRTWETLVIGVGNEASIFSAPSVLAKGTLEDILARSCHYDIGAVGPQDLARFRRDRRLPDALYQRVWSNVESLTGDSGFPSHRLLAVAGYRVALFSLVSGSLLDDLPMQEWGGLSVDNPARCLRRLMPLAADSDLILVVCHLDQADLFELLADADPRMRFIIVPQSSGKPLIPSSARSVTWIIGAGSTELTVYRREPRTGTHDWEKWHRFEIEKACATKAGEAIFSPHRKAFEKDWFTPKFFLNTKDLPPGRIYRFSPAFHARLAREIGRSDISIVGLEDEIPRGERALSPANIFAHFKNRFLREFELSGVALKSLFFTLGHGNFSSRLGLAGARCAFLAGNPQNLTVRGKPINERLKYRVMLDSNVYEDTSFKAVIMNAKRLGRRGLTLWDAWLELFSSVSHDSGIVERDSQ